MATSTCNTTKDILCCPICLEKLNNPKYLPCLHTFCKGCIQTYITSAFDKGDNEINCPICRFCVSVEKCSPEEWANNLPVNFLLLGMIDNENVLQKSTLCMLCDRLGVETDAIVLCINCSDTMCENCRKCHTVNKFTNDHEIMSLSEISEGKTIPKIFVNKCCEHKLKRIKFFCSDHSVPCCSMCVSTHHRKCDKVLSIEDAAKSFISDKCVDKIELNLVNTEQDMVTIVAHNTKCISDLEINYVSKVKTVEDACNELIGRVETFKVTKKSELKKLLDQKKDEIETHNVILENNMKAIRNEREILRLSKEETSGVQVMLESLKIHERTKDHQTLLKTKAIQCSEIFDIQLEGVDNVIKRGIDLEEICTTRINSHKSALPLTFRSSNITVKRFTESKHGWYTHTSTNEGIYFSVSRDIELTGVLSYGCPLSPTDSATIKVELNNDVIAETTFNLDKGNAKDGLIEASFSNTVSIKSKSKYHVIFKRLTNSAPTDYGDLGKSSIVCGGVTFNFENDPACCEGFTSVQRGQIPGFIFVTIN